jgi:hypothetical protein
MLNFELWLYETKIIHFWTNYTFLTVFVVSDLYKLTPYPSPKGEVKIFYPDNG